MNRVSRISSSTWSPKNYSTMDYNFRWWIKP